MYERATSKEFERYHCSSLPRARESRIGTLSWRSIDQYLKHHDMPLFQAKIQKDSIGDSRGKSKVGVSKRHMGRGTNLLGEA